MILTDEEVDAAILEFLLKKGRWGRHYFPLDTLVNWLGRKIGRNGKRVRKRIAKLTNKGYLILHKKGKTVSLNPLKKKEILQFTKYFYF